MAVNMSLDLNALISAVSDSQGQQFELTSLAKKLSHEGWVFKHGVVSLQASKGDISLSKNMPNLVGHALAGKLAGPSKTIFSQALLTFLHECYLQEEQILQSQNKVVWTIDSVPSSGTPLKMTMPSAMVDKQGGVPSGAPTGHGVVALKAATKVGQMVHGTSPGSQYKVVALHDHLKIACRLKGDSLSVRVEGPLLFDGKQGVAAKLSSMGFATSGDSHASMHCYVNPNLPASRVLGAVILSLGVDFKDIAPASSLNNAT